MGSYVAPLRKNETKETFNKTERQFSLNGVRHTLVHISKYLSFIIFCQNVCIRRHTY